MSLRSPTDNENIGIFVHVVLPSTRHSRARGNPGWFSAELAWIPAFAGTTEARGACSFCRSSPHMYFRRSTRSARRFGTFILKFVIAVAFAAS